MRLATVLFLLSPFVAAAVLDATAHTHGIGFEADVGGIGAGLFLQLDTGAAASWALLHGAMVTTCGASGMCQWAPTKHRVVRRPPGMPRLPFRVAYGDGTVVRGFEVASSGVRVQGKGFVSDGLPFGLVTAVKEAGRVSWFEALPFDGVLGAAFLADSATEASLVVVHNVGAAPVGSILFVPSSAPAHRLWWSCAPPVRAGGYWEVFAGLAAGASNTSAGISRWFAEDSALTVLVDTGASHVILPQSWRLPVVGVVHLVLTVGSADLRFDVDAKWVTYRPAPRAVLGLPVFSSGQQLVLLESRGVCIPA